MLERGDDPENITPDDLREHVLELENVEHLKDAIRRIFHEAVDREMCDSMTRGFALATIAGMCEEAIGPWCEKCEKIGCNCKNA